MAGRQLTTHGRARVLVSALTVSALLTAFGMTSAASAASARADMRWCSAHQLALSNAQGAHAHVNSMTAQYWAVQLRNQGRSACLAGGTLHFASVHTARGARVSVKFSYDSNAFGASPKAFVLKPHARAFAQIDDPIARSPVKGCATPARLTFELPHGGGRLSVLTPNQTSERFSVCPSLGISVSPIYSARVFDAYEYQLATSPAHLKSARRTATSRAAAGSQTTTPPPVCAPNDLTLTPSTTVASTGTVVTITVATSGSACLLIGAAPTLTFDGGSAGPAIAKIDVGGQAAALATSAQASFAPAGTPNSVGAEVEPGTPVQLVFVLPTGGTAACTSATSVTLYPGGSAMDAGAPAALPSAINVCGSPRTLPYELASTNAAAVGTSALKTVTTVLTTASVANDSSGYNYGTDDTSANGPCGSDPPFTEPIGECKPNGHDGTYGFYAGIEDAWDSWKGCNSGWPNLNPNAFDDAAADLVDDGEGGGGSIIWFGAGDGRNPNYDPSPPTTEATSAGTWGTDQAMQINTDAENDQLFSQLQFIWLDIESTYDYQGSGNNDYNGWNAIWTSPCNGTSNGSAPAAGLNYDVFEAFRNYIANDTYYLPGVYSAGGSSTYGPSTWDHIIGSSYTITNTLEWTSDTGLLGNVTTSSQFPTSFSDTAGGYSASWFAGAPPACQAVWQWNTPGTTGTYDTDLDQTYSSRLFGSCA